MSDTATASGTYETKAEGEKSPESFVKMWLDALNQQEEEEKDWVKKAEETADVYRGKRKARSRNFNILHSNVETLCPALYNSTPVPDVRRRFADADPAGKIVSDILERSLSFSIDNYDFDSVMKSTIHDGEVVGRGVPRVRYIPTFAPAIDPATKQPRLDENGQPIEDVVYEEATCEYVPWKYFRRGPGRTWADMPWIAFGDLLTRDEIRKLCGDARDKNNNLVAEQVPLNYSSAHKDTGRKTGTAEPTIFSRTLVWQVWDKDSRRVISICPDYKDAPLAMVDDPLGLSGFFPSPRPYQPILATDSLVPIVPYEIYEDLVLELNEVTARIAKLIKQLRPRGGYAGAAGDINAIAGADDGELVPCTSVEQFIANGGLEKAIAWFPLEPTVKALQQLVIQREEIKQIIYEVTGIADIMRGSTQASETAAAQQIKAQWGSLRIQDRQADVARLARDILELKADVIAGKFSWETLAAMTGIDAPTNEERDQARQQIQQADMATRQATEMAAMQQQQPGLEPAGTMMGQQETQAPQPIVIPEEVKKLASQPTREEILAVLRSDITRRYRVDIESDSTIRGDLTRNQQTMNTFLQGTAQFAQAMGPIIQLDKSLLTPALEVYAAFARQFKLGKQAEDALDSLSEKARQIGSQPPQAPPPDPRLEAEKFKAGAAMKQTEMDMAFAEKKHGMDMEKLTAEGVRDQQKFDLQQQAAAGPIDLPKWPYRPDASAALPPE